MKALCVRQPWAWLLFHGKNIENRDWFTAYMGPLIIVASKGMTRDEYEDAREFVARFDPGLAERIPERESLVYGAALGTVRQIGCARWAESPWFQGKFGHLYIQPGEFSVPVLTKGRLGIFELDTPEIMAALRLCGAAVAPPATVDKAPAATREEPGPEDRTASVLPLSQEAVS